MTDLPLRLYLWAAAKQEIDNNNRAVASCGALHPSKMNKQYPVPPITRYYLLPAALTAVLSGSAIALNDTGMTACCSDVTAPVVCDPALLADSGTYPRQDARFGRDANPSPGKVGAGDGGFDFTKISNAGNPLPAGAALGSAPGDWACTRDNVTGLLWEVKTSNPGSPGLRDSSHTYTWYDPNPATNGGDAGGAGSPTSCSSTLAACNTADYVSAVNATNLCGRSDWRLPSYKEIVSIFNAQAAGSAFTPFDPTYFLSRGTTAFTSNTSRTTSTSAWVFNYGVMSVSSKTAVTRQVRLVAGTNAFQ